MQISGRLRLGEAQATMRKIGARQRGSLVYYYGVMIALGLTFAALGIYVLPRFADVEPAVGGGFGWAIGVVIYIILAPRTIRLFFRRRLGARGIASELPFTVTLTPVTLECESGDVRQIAKWPAVTELFRSKGYWIFMVQGGAIFAPQRFFASSADERAFVAQALSHMMPDARTRSIDAKLFAEAVPRLA
jgi:hypothetical protein